MFIHCRRNFLLLFELLMQRVKFLRYKFRDGEYEALFSDFIFKKLAIIGVSKSWTFCFIWSNRSTIIRSNTFYCLQSFICLFYFSKIKQTFLKNNRHTINKLRSKKKIIDVLYTFSYLLYRIFWTPRKISLHCNALKTGAKSHIMQRLFFGVETIENWKSANDAQPERSAIAIMDQSNL